MRHSIMELSLIDRNVLVYNIHSRCSRYVLLAKYIPRVFSLEETSTKQTKLGKH